MFWLQVRDIFIKYWPMLLDGTLLTLEISIIGTIIGAIIGLCVGVIRTIPLKKGSTIRNFFIRFFSAVLQIYIEVFRGTPMIVQAMVIFYGVPLLFGYTLNTTFAALFIVSINTGAYMSEIVRGGIVSVDKGQFEGAHALGMTHWKTMKCVILPQVIRNILPATGNEFIINIKDTSVLNVISVNELFFRSKSIAGMNFMYFQTFAITSVIYLILTFSISRILRFVEKKIDGPSNYALLEEEPEVANAK